MTQRDVQIAVFAKPPVAGRAKTRLIPALGPEGAAQLHATLVARTLEMAVAADIGPVTLWCADDTGHPLFDDLATRLGLERRQQRGSDLGERMFHAFEHHCPTGPLILIGTDCPALEGKTLAQAAQTLRTHDAVFVPAEDGGYVLTGFNRPERSAFQNVPWGGPEVMARTRLQLQGAAVRWAELDAHWDLDRPEDLPRFLALTHAKLPLTT